MLTSSQYCTTEGHPSVSPNDDSGVAMPTTPPREQHQEQPRRRPSQRQRYSQEAMRQILEMSPRGYYLAHEVGWLAGVSGDRIGQWARRGYIRSSVSSVVPRVYSFQDVAEAMVVHELLLRRHPLAEDQASDQPGSGRVRSLASHPSSHSYRCDRGEGR